ncbi:MAG: IPTL-CTERM sorting domain-containing protein, partial [bacterium]|nr:IPTL-CTERM sorting domain-containing protein [bacterium]
EVRAPASIPTVSEWGLAIMTLLLLTAGTVVLIRRQPGEAQPTR